MAEKAKRLPRATLNLDDIDRQRMERIRDLLADSNPLYPRPSMMDAVRAALYVLEGKLLKDLGRTRDEQ